MLVADDDDDILEQQSQESALAEAIRGYDPNAECEVDADDTTSQEDHFKILPLVLQMLQAQAGESRDGDRLAMHLSAIHKRMKRCEDFIAEHEASLANDDQQQHQRSAGLLAKRTDLLLEHTRRRLPLQKRSSPDDET